MESEEHTEESSWITHMVTISDFAKETFDFLELFQSNGLRKINIYRYPL